MPNKKKKKHMELDFREVEFQNAVIGLQNVTIGIKNATIGPLELGMGTNKIFLQENAAIGL